MCKENNAALPFVLRGAIFDMDGTLLDSMWIWEQYASQYICSRGLVPAPGLDDRLATATIEAAAELLRREYHLPESAAAVVADIEQTVTRLYERVVPMPGVMVMLEAFRAAGVCMAVATLTERADAERVLGRLGILPYLSGIFTCTEVGAPKTRPDVFDAALSALGTRRAETAVFEDAPYALRTAHAAGFPTVAVGNRAVEATYALLTVDDFAAVPWSQYLPKKSAIS